MCELQSCNCILCNLLMKMKKVVGFSRFRDNFNEQVATITYIHKYKHKTFGRKTTNTKRQMMNKSGQI